MTEMHFERGDELSGACLHILQAQQYSHLSKDLIWFYF